MNVDFKTIKIECKFFCSVGKWIDFSLKNRKKLRLSCKSFNWEKRQVWLVGWLNECRGAYL